MQGAWHRGAITDHWPIGYIIQEQTLSQIAIDLRNPYSTDGQSANSKKLEKQVDFIAEYWEEIVEWGECLDINA